MKSRMEFFKKLPKVYYFYFCTAIFAVFIFTYFASGNSAPIEYISENILKNEDKKEEIEKPIVEHIPPPDAVKGIYMTSWVAGTKDWREDLVRFVDRTEINAIVIDVKDYSGRVSFETGNSKVKEVGSEEKRIRDLPEFIKYLHSKNIYVIARITVFQDPFYAKKYPASAVQKNDGSVWKDRKGLSFVDPLAKDYWDYMVELSRASEQAGFDEINYDYIRFPSDGDMKNIVFPLSGNMNKADALDRFFSYLRKELKEGGGAIPIPLSADIFGMTTTNYDDLGIGQILERVEKHFDYVLPMVYPSHYPPKFHGFKNPADHPYEIIKHAMTSAHLRMSSPTSTPEKLRPWIQDFDLGAEYDATKVRAQIQATYDSGLDSWISWDPANRYTIGAYKIE